MPDRNKTIFGTLLASLLSICGCGQPAAPPNQRADEPKLIEEIAINGFDPDGEPVIKKWSDGSLWIHFEAMPPFFAEDDNTDTEFETFELIIQDALGVPVRRDVREVFIIEQPKPDTAEEAKAWLESYRKNRA